MGKLSHTREQWDLDGSFEQTAGQELGVKRNEDQNEKS